MKKIVCVADQHGKFDQAVPECDLLIVAGDMCFNTSTAAEFHWWLEASPADDVVVIGGNMDHTLSRNGYPPFCRGHYLEDSGVELPGFKVWGTPWTPNFVGEWNDTEKELDKHFAKIPVGTDILVVHGPPHGYLDSPSIGRAKKPKHVGSKALLDVILDVQPTLVVCGHIHASHGEDYIDGGIHIVNCAVANGKPPIEVDW